MPIINTKKINITASIYYDFKDNICLICKGELSSINNDNIIVFSCNHFCHNSCCSDMRTIECIQCKKGVKNKISSNELTKISFIENFVKTVCSQKEQEAKNKINKCIEPLNIKIEKYDSFEEYISDEGKESMIKEYENSENSYEDDYSSEVDSSNNNSELDTEYEKERKLQEKIHNNMFKNKKN